MFRVYYVSGLCVVTAYYSSLSTTLFEFISLFQIACTVRLRPSSCRYTSSVLQRNVTLRRVQSLFPSVMFVLLNDLPDSLREDKAGDGVSHFFLTFLDLNSINFQY